MKLHQLLKTCVIVMAITITTTTAAAERLTTNQPEIASNVIFVKTPKVYNAIKKDHAAKVFIRINNTGQKTHRIVAAFSPVAEQVQLHMTEHHGRSRMHQINDIVIKPHIERDLKLGGAHIMLIGLKEKLKKGQNIPIALIFDDGSWTTLFAKVS